MSAKDQLDNQLEGQITLADMYAPPERMTAVHRIFARARQEMTLAEQKAFVCALSKLDFTQEPPKDNCVRIPKKELAAAIGLKSDPNHLSVHLHDAIKDLWVHSSIHIADKDLDLYSDGAVVSSVTIFRNIVRFRFNEDYLPLFTNLKKDYITLWSSDIFGLTSLRSVQFYEYLRQITDDRQTTNTVALGVKALKEMFGIPKEGKGSYIRPKSAKSPGGFDRTNFERYVLQPLCEDLRKCKMITLIVQPDGKYYVKVKPEGRVDGYRFFWTFTKHPAVATAAEVQEIQKRVDEDPEVLKIAADILSGRKKKQKNNPDEPYLSPSARAFHNFDERDTDYDELVLGRFRKEEPEE